MVRALYMMLKAHDAVVGADVVRQAVTKCIDDDEAVKRHVLSPGRQSQALFNDSLHFDVDEEPSSSGRRRSRSPRIMLARAVPTDPCYLDPVSPVYTACQGVIEIK